MHARAHRGACGRAEGVDRGRGRLPRECGELEVGVARSKAARDAGAGFGGGRWGAGLLGGGAGGWPATREQRDWCHKIANVLDKLPKRLQGRAKRALHEIMYAETRAQAERGIEAFVAEFSPKYEKAVDCLIKDREALLAFFDFPAEHWKHLRTSNPIESSFATVRLRQRVTKGAGSRAKALTMAFKLLMLAQERWRKLNGAHLLPLVRARVQFVDGVQTERRTHEENRKEAA